jgi:hypothetical protein
MYHVQLQVLPRGGGGGVKKGKEKVWRIALLRFSLDGRKEACNSGGRRRWRLRWRPPQLMKFHRFSCLIKKWVAFASKKAHDMARHFFNKTPIGNIYFA